MWGNVVSELAVDTRSVLSRSFRFRATYSSIPTFLACARENFQGKHPCMPWTHVSSQRYRTAGLRIALGTHSLTQTSDDFILFSLTAILVALPSSNYISCGDYYISFIFNVSLFSKGEKSYSTAKRSPNRTICYIKQILIYIIATPTSISAQRHKQQHSVQRDVVMLDLLSYWGSARG